MKKIDYTKKVNIPNSVDMNSGLHPAHQFTMLDTFGEPGAKTKDCSPITNSKLDIVTVNMANFRITGEDKAIASLQGIMNDIYDDYPDLWSIIRTEGMACCRLVRNSKRNFSNHSWGTAIDLRVGTLDQYGSHKCSLGILTIYPYFHKHGWFWGAEFPIPDSMHLEMSDELVRKVYA